MPFYFYFLLYTVRYEFSISKGYSWWLSSVLLNVIVFPNNNNLIINYKLNLIFNNMVCQIWFYMFEKPIDWQNINGVGDETIIYYIKFALVRIDTSAHMWNSSVPRKCFCTINRLIREQEVPTAVFHLVLRFSVSQNIFFGAPFLLLDSSKKNQTHNTAIVRIIRVYTYIQWYARL